MSSSNSRSGLGRFFHRRGASKAANESERPVTAHRQTQRSESTSNGAPRRSFGDVVRSRSLSRSRNTHRRIQSAEIPSVPIVPDGVNVPSRPRTRDSRPPQRPTREALPTDQSLLTLRATGPSVPPRRSSMSRSGPMAEPNNALPIYTSMVRRDDPYSEQVAERNLARDKRPARDVPRDVPLPLRVAKFDDSAEIDSRAGSYRHAVPAQLNHKPDVEDLRSSVDEERYFGQAPYDPTSAAGMDSAHPIPRKSLDKALPSVPAKSMNRALNVAEQASNRPDSGIDSELGQERKYAVEDSANPIDLSGVVDLTHTEETHEYTKWAPAVTHEKRVINTHEIVQEAVTREIHNHHIFHRILPVIDIEVLPPRHFIIGDDGRQKEIPETEIPGGNNSAQLHQLISEAVAKMLPKNTDITGPRQFTARKFEGTEGDYQEYITPEGTKRTEQWWVHPPTLETGAQESGQTQPFHLGSERPEYDGLRDWATSSATPNFSRKPLPVDQTSLPPRESSTHTVLPIRMQHAEVAS